MEELKEIRKKQGWTQKQFSEYFEIPLITYVQWENGKRKAPEYLLKLMKYKWKNDTKQIKILENLVAGEVVKINNQVLGYHDIACTDDLMNAARIVEGYEPQPFHFFRADELDKTRAFAGYAIEKDYDDNCKAYYTINFYEKVLTSQTKL